MEQWGAIRRREFLYFNRYQEDRRDHGIFDSPRQDLPAVVTNSSKTGHLPFFELVSHVSSRLHAAESSGDNEESRAVLADFYVRLGALARTQFGVCCFSTDSTNILMWSHYSDNHTGVVLGFDDSIRLFQKRSGISCHEVEYSPQRGVDVGQEGWPKAFVKLFTRKSPGWSYENEIRYISHNGPGLVSFKRRVLRSLVLGARFASQLANETSRDRAIRLLETVIGENKVRPKGEKIHVYRAYKVPETFAVDVRRVADLRRLMNCLDLPTNGG